MRSRWWMKPWRRDPLREINRILEQAGDERREQVVRQLMDRTGWDRETIELMIRVGSRRGLLYDDMLRAARDGSLLELMAKANER